MESNVMYSQWWLKVDLLMWSGDTSPKIPHMWWTDRMNGKSITTVPCCLNSWWTCQRHKLQPHPKQQIMSTLWRAPAVAVVFPTDKGHACLPSTQNQLYCYSLLCSRAVYSLCVCECLFVCVWGRDRRQMESRLAWLLEHSLCCQYWYRI